MQNTRTKDEEIRLPHFRRKQLREQLTWLGWVAVVALGLFLTIHYFVELAIR